MTLGNPRDDIAGRRAPTLRPRKGRLPEATLTPQTPAATFEIDVLTEWSSITAETRNSGAFTNLQRKRYVCISFHCLRLFLFL